MKAYCRLPINNKCMAQGVPSFQPPLQAPYLVRHCAQRRQRVARCLQLLLQPRALLAQCGCRVRQLRLFNVRGL